VDRVTPVIRPTILAVVEEKADLPRVEEELRRRYSADYDVGCTSSPAQAHTELTEKRAAGRPVALVLADRWRSGADGRSFLEVVGELHPFAKRVLLIDWGAWREPSTAAAVLEAMQTAGIDYYAVKPRSSPDEDFHRLLTELLQEWARAHSPAASEATLIGEEGTRRVHELRTMLASSGIPYRFEQRGSSTARRLLGGREQRSSAATAPVLVVREGQVLSDPSNTEVAGAFRSASTQRWWTGTATEGWSMWSYGGDPPEPPSASRPRVCSY
jgi:thioredoxin reductase (NADPH)